MKRPLAAGAVSLAMAAALLVTGWTYASPGTHRDDSGEAASELCESISELRDDTKLLTELGTDSTRDEFRDVYDDVRDDWDDVEEDLGNLSSDTRKPVRKAADDLQSAYDDLPDDASVRDKVSELKPEAKKLRSALRDAADDVKC